MNHIFVINVQDVQRISLERIGRELTLDEIEEIKKGVEFGLELSWEEVIATSIDEIVDKT